MLPLRDALAFGDCIGGLGGPAAGTWAELGRESPENVRVRIFGLLAGRWGHRRATSDECERDRGPYSGRVIGTGGKGGEIAGVWIGGIGVAEDNSSAPHTCAGAADEELLGGMLKAMES